MTGDLPPAPGEGPTAGPPGSTQWAPVFPAQPQSRARTWPAIVLAVLATIVAVAALIRTFTLSAPESPKATGPIYSAADAAAAHQRLCDSYRLTAHAVQIETNGTNQAFAGIATVNGAVMLEHAVNTNPALASNERSAALALAEVYSNVAATASLAGGQDAAWQSVLNEANAKDAVMKKICGGG
jgi:hypothetical protein